MNNVYLWEVNALTRKILVFSDSHEETEYMRKAIGMNSDADLTVHLGDGASDLSRNLPDNCSDSHVFIEGNGEYYGWIGIDRRYRPQKTALIEFEGKRIFMTHGHLYEVKSGLEKLLARAYSDGADIVLFGHTHVPLIQYIPEGTDLDYVGKTDRPLLVFNPGSIGQGFQNSFGLLTFRNGEVLPSHGRIL